MTEIMETTYFDLVDDVRNVIYGLLVEDQATLWCLQRVCRSLRREVLPLLRSSASGGGTIETVNAHIGQFGHLNIFRWLRDKNKWNLRLDVIFYNAIIFAQEEILSEIKIEAGFLTETKLEAWTPDDLVISTIPRGTKHPTKIKLTISKAILARHLGRSKSGKIIEWCWPSVWKDQDQLADIRSSFHIVLQNILDNDNAGVIEYLFSPRTGEFVSALSFSESTLEVVRSTIGSNTYEIMDPWSYHSFDKLIKKLNARDFFYLMHQRGAINIQSYILNSEIHRDLYLSTFSEATTQLLRCFHANTYKMIENLSDETIKCVATDLSNIFSLRSILAMMNYYCLKFVLSVIPEILDKLTEHDKNTMLDRFNLVDYARDCREINLEETTYGLQSRKHREDSERKFFKLVTEDLDLFDKIFLRHRIIRDISMICTINIDYAQMMISAASRVGLAGWVGLMVYDDVYSFLRGDLTLKTTMVKYLMWCHEHHIVIDRGPLVGPSGGKDRL